LPRQQSSFPWHVARPAVAAGILALAFCYLVALPVADALLPILWRVSSTEASANNLAVGGEDLAHRNC
jgi:hypothetical protein